MRRVIKQQVNISKTQDFDQQHLALKKYNIFRGIFDYRCSSTSDFSELSIDKMKRLMNHVSEYWYMGSMLARSAMEKNSTAEWFAIGV